MSLRHIGEVPLRVVREQGVAERFYLSVMVVVFLEFLCESVVFGLSLAVLVGGCL